MAPRRPPPRRSKRRACPCSTSQAPAPCAPPSALLPADLVAQAVNARFCTPCTRAHAGCAHLVVHVAAGRARARRRRACIHLCCRCRLFLARSRRLASPTCVEPAHSPCRACPAALPVGALSADWSTAPRLRREPEAPSPPQPHVRSADIVAFGGLQRFWRAAVGCQHTIALLSRGGCCARVPSMGGCSPSACSRLQALTPGLACACPAAVSWQAFDRMRACRGRTPTSCGREPPSACCWYQCSAACPK